MNTIYRFNPGDYVIRPDAEVPKAEKITHLKLGHYWTDENSHYEEHKNLRLATNEEIIAAGGTPNKVELNYEIY